MVADGGTYRCGSGAWWALKTRGSADTRIRDKIIAAWSASDIISRADGSSRAIFAHAISEDFVGWTFDLAASTSLQTNEVLVRAGRRMLVGLRVQRSGRRGK
jgi:hypothetical protein